MLYIYFKAYYFLGCVLRNLIDTGEVVSIEIAEVVPIETDEVVPIDTNEVVPFETF